MSEKFRHIVLHTHQPDGKEVIPPSPMKLHGKGSYICDEMEEAVKSKERHTAENGGHRFGVFTLVPRD